MNLEITGIKNRKIKSEIQISGSKSESNRLLILQQLFPNISLSNLSDSDDTDHLQFALSSKENTINIGHAGTAMRFLTAYFALQKNKTFVLSGSERMHNRPIKILVNALRDLGADIDFLEKEGFPPLKIHGIDFTKNQVYVNGNVSSQYITALLLIAPSLPDGLIIHLEGKVTSVPYIKMTLSLLTQLGIESHYDGQTIKVKHTNQIKNSSFTIESDWSSASYFYSILALSDLGSELKLSFYKQKSLQGDSVLSEIYKSFGVETVFLNNSILLRKVSNPSVNNVAFDLNSSPDIAQTIVVTAYGLGVKCYLTGLHTLKIKETDRLEAIKNELSKLGAEIKITNDSLTLHHKKEINSNVKIATYNDHRMAMAFAPLALITPITIMDAEVVSKSYKSFWKDLVQIGFQIDKK